MLTDLNLQIYQMMKNGYTRIEIADSLNKSDADIDKIIDYNAYHLNKLKLIDNGQLSLKDA